MSNFLYWGWSQAVDATPGANGRTGSVSQRKQREAGEDASLSSACHCSATSYAIAISGFRL